VVKTLGTDATVAMVGVAVLTLEVGFGAGLAVGKVVSANKVVDAVLSLVITIEVMSVPLPNVTVYTDAETGMVMITGDVPPAGLEIEYVRKSEARLGFMVEAVDSAAAAVVVSIRVNQNDLISKDIVMYITNQLT
jgi:hypothetical protein